MYDKTLYEAPPSRLKTFINHYNGTLKTDLYGVISGLLLSQNNQVDVFIQDSEHRYLVVDGPVESPSLAQMADESSGFDRTMCVDIDGRVQCYYR